MFHQHEKCPIRVSADFVREGELLFEGISIA
jgi:hypothetical protein